MTEISFLDFQISFSISQAAIPLVLRTEFFLREPFPTPQGGVVALPGKSKTGNPVFLVHSTNTSPAPRPGLLILLASSPACYPVATVSASIRRTMLANNRRPSWLSPSDSQQCATPSSLSMWLAHNVSHNT
ncbi:MAG: hypothetical protein ABSE21_04695 [Bryobacteraceae bacterium]